MANGESVVEHATHGPDVNGAKLTLEDPAIKALIEQEVQKRLKPKAKPQHLQETFALNCPVHGLMFLPQYVKWVIDTPDFQRMRHIKQLGVCAQVYPGATHNRFFHSIGTAYLAMTFIQTLRHEQPQLEVTDRDEICVVLAGLCHDLGHPCYSHMFESFLRQLGREKRKEASARHGEQIPPEVEQEIAKFETWDHEKASLVLVQKLMDDLREKLVGAGLKADGEGDDFALIKELIDPPKKTLRQLGKEGKLRSSWSTVMKGRPVEKAWIYEIVSNWRTGIDVDKFDYFRRDAQHLGIQRQWDHMRYIKSARVILDDNEEKGIPTISPPEKDRDNIRENLMELRKTLHRTAYQHKTVKKLEQHIIDILKLIDKVPLITGTDGKMTISEAAVKIDPIAYPKLTDIFVESRLMDEEDDRLKDACAEYKARFLERKLMRMPQMWTLPTAEENSQFKMPEEDSYLDQVLEVYNTEEEKLKRIEPLQPFRPVPREELRCTTAELNYGMGTSDPIMEIIFHDKQYQKKDYDNDPEANPHRRKLFVFWNPPEKDLGDSATPSRLCCAALHVAQQYNGKDSEMDVTPASPMKPKRTSGVSLDPPPAPTTPVAPPAKKRRVLNVQSSFM